MSENCLTNNSSKPIGLGLVNNYISDSDEENELNEDEITNTKINFVSDNLSINENSSEAKGPNFGNKSTASFLFSNSLENSDQSSDSDCEKESNISPSPPAPFSSGTSCLPPPTFQKKSSTKSSVGKSVKMNNSSVFVNSYQLETLAKDSVLEQHVKMTAPPVEQMSAVKKPCHSFRRGKCRLGSRCRFIHDAVIGPPKVHSAQPIVNKSLLGSEMEEESAISQTKKKRPGLSQSLVPPKRAMQSLNAQRKVERPWTFAPE